MKLIFCVQINVKGFFNLILSFWVCMARHAKITKNNKFSISLQYFIKEVSDDVEFLQTECFLQSDTIILMGMVNVFTISQKRS